MYAKTIKRVLSLTMISTLVLASSAWADSTGRITGVVVDDDNHIVANLQVTATDLIDSSNVYMAMSDAAGRYQLLNVPIGSYLVTLNTSNTSWVQKSESPVVVVSSGAASTSRLVVTTVSQLSGSGNDDGSHKTLAWIGTGSAVVAAGLAGLAYAESNDGKEDGAAEHDRLQQSIEELQRQINALRRDLASVLN